ncbi:hypothetical protein B296_00045468 [Ensete ventricosum]|uniref:Uncharacterized protein n=1 Tax=Ensete ventricosum TaxID=4639 RepID=A0A426YQ30_ENSVE|nr:hypothetical protein B296_00045468 [Ensete ventricosum]
MHGGVGGETKGEEKEDEDMTGLHRPISTVVGGEAKALHHSIIYAEWHDVRGGRAKMRDEVKGEKKEDEEDDHSALSCIYIDGR